MKLEMGKKDFLLLKKKKRFLVFSSRSVSALSSLGGTSVIFRGKYWIIDCIGKCLAVGAQLHACNIKFFWFFFFGQSMFSNEKLLLHNLLGLNCFLLL